MGREGARALRGAAHRRADQATGVQRRARHRRGLPLACALRRARAGRIRHRHAPHQRPRAQAAEHRHEAGALQRPAGGQAVRCARQDAVRRPDLPQLPAAGLSSEGQLRSEVMLKITIAQINPTIGDLEGNLALHLDAARCARHDGADLVVFPELSLTGYYPADLLDDEDFRERLDRAMAALLAATREVSSLHWGVGAPTRNPGAGKAFRNSLLVIRDGELLLDYHKQLLPTYNVFDERRHFEPGPDVARVLRIGGAQVGFMICEDGWNDDGKDYTVNPFQRLADSVPDLIVSINASPSHVGKRELRHEVFRAACWRHRLPLVFVNQIGGHDQLVYDGASFAIEPEPGVVFEARRFEEQVVTLGFEVDRGHFASLDGGALPPAATGLDTMAFYRRQIVLGLRDYARRCGFGRVVG